MQHGLPESDLSAALETLGLSLFRTGGTEDSGFPGRIILPDGRACTLKFEAPPLVGYFGSDLHGAAFVGVSGRIESIWGVACGLLGHSTDIRTIPFLGSFFRNAQRGQPGSVYHEGFRWYVCPIKVGDGFAALFLVFEANEEGEARAQAEQSHRKADVLKKIGKVLTMHQTLQPMAVAAAHAIATATELAAVMMWVRSGDDEPLELVASVGANRVGISALSKIDPARGNSCIAEVAASSGRFLVVPDVKQDPSTAEIEGKLCYLTAGGLMVWPLTIGGRLVGLLELVSRAGDEAFLTNEDLYMTVAEHLSLAFNSALMFETAEKQASYDPLTGIANHRAMQDFLYKRIMEAERSHSEIGVIMLDVDHFRRFNEEEGHDAGDRVLKMVAAVLKSCVREYDLAARYGGEEFTVIMPGSDSETTFAVGERIRSQIAKLDYKSAAGETRRITASLGCAIFPTNGQDSPTVLKAADLALYEAKRTTRNRVVLYKGECENESATSVESLLSIVLSLVPAEERSQAQAVLETSKGYVAHVSGHFGFSAVQQQTLQAAILLLCHWTRLAGSGQPESLDRLRKDKRLHAVTACLNDLGERFDGRGPRKVQGDTIPLLTRVLAALQALVLEQGKPFVKDLGKFDPEIVALMAGTDQAA